MPETLVNESPVRGVRPYGPHAVLVEVADEHVALALVEWLRASEVACTDAVPAARTVLIDGLDSVDALRPALEGWQPTPADLAARTGREVVVAVDYDGPDLAHVAASWAVDVDEVVRRHTSLEFVSAFCGFAPGFAYLSGLPSAWAVPRLDTPRTRVPRGSVGLADTWCGVYPTASPGGWLLLGTTQAPVWDLERSEQDGGPALLAPGTRVRFVAR